MKKKNKTKSVKRRKNALLRSAAATGAVLGGTALYANGNPVLAETMSTSMYNGRQPENIRI